MDHRGEKAKRIKTFLEVNLNELNSKTIYIKTTNSSFNQKAKSKNLEFNKLDRLVTKDAMELANDIHNLKARRKNIRRCELNAKTKMASAERPTTVTFVNVFGGKKHRQTVHEGLRVLLDSGCSDSLLLSSYVKQTKK